MTDRRQLAPDQPDQRQIESLIAFVETAASAGVDLVQVRERDLPVRVLEWLVVRCVQVTAATSTRIIVNDRLDVAIGAGAAGVHLRGNSFDASRARAITDDRFVIGRSVHAAEEAGAVVADVDYLVFGTVFESTSKPGRAPAGSNELERVARSSSVRVLAIGGVTLDRLPTVRAAGAAGIAAIGLFVHAVRAGANGALVMAETVRAVRRAFDSPQPLV